MAAVDVIPPTPAFTGGFVNPVDGPFVRFPPFPVSPQDTTVMSYKDFKERGICMEPGPDDAEVDALGIPTVPLPKSHKTDMCKTNTKRKRKAEEATARKKAGVPGAHVVFWEQWDETEMIRFSLGFNPHSPRYERLFAAAGDFTTGRTWPTNFASETGPRYIWEKFQRYIGIPEGTVAPPKEKKKAGQKDEDDDISDDDMDDNEDAEGLDESTSGPMAANVINDRDLQGMLARNKAAATNEANLARFFDNPEKSVRVFLSSYARAKGYIWSDANLMCMPRVLYFFINFLLRSKVLPESERSLRRAVEVIQVAQIELPNTSSLSKILPDRFSQACNVSWGRKAEGYKLREDPDNAGEEAPQPKVEGSKPDLPIASNQDSDWGQGNAPGWGSATDSETPWGSSNDSNVWAHEIGAEEATSGWILLDNEKLSEELGLTALSLTHRTGIVETSMRRVKSIVGPNANPPPKPPQAEGSSVPDPEAVEIDLDAKFTKVVLSPMPVDWDGGENPVYSRPVILNTSQGAVVEPGVPVPEGTTPKPHDPLNDDITLLIESDEAHVKLLREGMLIGGIWVQIVRQGEAAKKKKKGKSKKSAPVYWYLDELALIAPSFWAVHVADQESN